VHRNQCISVSSAFPRTFIHKASGEALHNAVRNSIMFWAVNDAGPGVVWRMNGYIPQRVSTFAIEKPDQGWTRAGLDTSERSAMLTKTAGSVYVLELSHAGKTLA